jgi:hypothetical protein
MHERDAERALLLVRRQCGRAAHRMPAMHRGVQRGEAPLRSLLSPKSRGLGIEGAFLRHEATWPRRSVALRGLFWIPASAGMTRSGGLPGQVSDLTLTKRSNSDELLRLSPSPPPSPIEGEETVRLRACRRAEPLVGLCNLQVRNPKRVQGQVPAEGLGVSPNSPSLPP